MTISEFENKWVQKINEELLKHFPKDFLESNDCELLNLPSKPLLKGSELFGNYEIIDFDGVPLITTNSLDKVKYILYANIGKPQSVKIPKVDSEIKLMIRKYEKHLDDILRMIIIDFKSQFPTSGRHVSASSKIFKLLNIHRY